MTKPMALYFSGIQPTGRMHLGNYLGAIRQWVRLQAQAPMVCCIVDAHAITVPQDPRVLREAIVRTAMYYLASGMDPERATIFVQSTIPGHSQLGWMLGCLTPMGWLNRMTQFKEKSGKHKDGSSLGLYGYPVLQAADILLYHATHVPVGEDQKQHLELTRDIALAYHRHVGAEYFPLPEPLIVKNQARIMSLRDGSKKMSKSDPSEASRIHLDDSTDEIAQKIRRATTDPHPIACEGAEERPELWNLASIGAALTGQSVEDTLRPLEGKGFAVLKEMLTELLVAELTPIREAMDRWRRDPQTVLDLLRRGTELLAPRAEATIRDVCDAMGLGIPL